MNINRNNYEEFLLLYLDNELNSHQLNAVEIFLQQNPDLQQEFFLLQETKLLNEPISNFNKTSLYKSTVATIHQNNYQEQFLLYNDNELLENEKQAVKEFIGQNAWAENEFLTLQKTILKQEKIICPNKHSLYKKERKPIIVIWMKRLTVAASIILLAITAWKFSNKNIVTNTDTAAINNKNNSKNNSTVVTNNNNQSYNINTEEEKPQPTVIENKNLVTVEKKQQAIKTNTTVNTTNNNTITDNNSTTAYYETKQNIVEVQEKEMSMVVAANKIIKTTNNNFSNLLAQNNNATTTILTNQQPTIKYLDITEDEVNNEKDKVEIGNLNINKSKLNKVFKKAKNIFKKDSDSYKDETSVATL